MVGVRKRVIIAGVIAFLGVVVVVFMIAQRPKRGSVEYHKREYVKASEDGFFGAFLTRGRGPVQRWYSRRETERKEFHRQALIEAGYLGEKVFVISNRAPINVLPELTRSMFDAFTMQDEAGYPVVRTFTTSNITVVGLSNEMHKWDDVIRKVDVPVNGQ